MKTYRSVQLDLLCELDQLCRENNIPYVLSRYTARAAANNHSLPQKAVIPTVAMRYADALRLAALSQAPDRTTEHALSNRRMAHFVMRYARPDTTCIKVDEWRACRYPGICVDIELIRPVPAKGMINKVWKIAEALGDITAELRCLPSMWRIVLPVCVPLEKLVLRMAYTGRPFGTSKNLRIARFPKKSVEFPESMLINRQEIEVDGKLFFVPKELERYLNLEFGEVRLHDDPEFALEDLALTVIDPETPCQQSLELIRQFYGKGPKVNWTRRFILRGRMRVLRKKIQQYWDILDVTRDRFSLWKQLMPVKKKICDQFEMGEYDAVRAELIPYLAALDRYLPKGFALCFDADLFEIALSLLKADGREHDVQRLRTLVLPEHLKPLKIEGFEYD